MYERFTDKARKVMQLANQEARRLGHDHVGTGHILLGLVKEGSGIGANVLRNLDIDLNRVRDEVVQIIELGPEAVVTTGKLPQTPRAKQVNLYAQEEARNLNHNYVGTEHLLLALLREREGVAARILVNLGVELKDVRSEVRSLLGGFSTESWTTAGSPRARNIDQFKYSDRARKVLLLAAEEAYNLGHTYIGPEHILLGIYREGTGIGVEVLNGAGMTESRVREEIQNIIRVKNELKGWCFQLNTAAFDSILLAGLLIRVDEVDSDHLLLGVLTESETLSSHCERLVTHLFQNLEIDLSDICRAIRFRLESGEN